MSSIEDTRVKNKIFKCFEILLWAFSLYCFIYVTISDTQVFKDIYYYGATSAFLIILLLWRRVKLDSLYIWMIGVIYALYCVNYLYEHRTDWGYQYAFMLLMRFAMLGLLLICVIDILRVGLKTEYIGKNKTVLVLTILAFGAGTIWGHDYVTFALCPLLVLFFTPMTSEEWKQRLYRLSEGAYLTFLFLMGKSFILAPDNFKGGRYHGIFVFPVAGGVLATFAIIAVLYRWNYLKEKGKNSKKCFIIHAIALGVAVVASVLVFDRAAVAGQLLMLLAIIVMAKRDAKSIKKRSIIVVAVAAIALVMLIVATNYTLKSNISVSSNSKGHDIRAIMGGLFVKKSITGVFPDYTILTAFDNFSNGRIGIWYLGIKQIKLLGGSELGVTLSDTWYMGHVHNTYIDWLLRLGVIGGIPVIMWFFKCIIEAVKGYYHKRTELYFSFFWGMFCMAFFMLERELWTDSPAFMFILLQYPLLVRFTDERS